MPWWHRLCCSDHRTSSKTQLLRPALKLVLLYPISRIRSSGSEDVLVEGVLVLLCRCTSCMHSCCAHCPCLQLTSEAPVKESGRQQQSSKESSMQVPQSADDSSRSSTSTADMRVMQLLLDCCGSLHNCLKLSRTGSQA